MSFARLLGFRHDRRGAVLTEFAFALPLLVAILLGCVEATRYVLVHQKLDRIATSMADMVAQADGISAAQVDDLFDAAEQLAEPYGLLSGGRILVSSVFRPTSAAATVAWQRQSPGTFAVTSRVGTVSGTATLPAGLAVRTGENVIVAEVWYSYRPLFGALLFGEAQFYHAAYNRPRSFNLTTLN